MNLTAPLDQAASLLEDSRVMRELVGEQHDDTRAILAAARLSGMGSSVQMGTVGGHRVAF